MAEVPWTGVAVVLALLVGAGIPGMAPPAPRCHPDGGASSARTPIRHIFFLVKENHAFENYFGDLPGVIGYPPNGSLPAGPGRPPARPYWIDGWTTADLPHARSDDLADLDGGRNDGFVATATAEGASDPGAAMGYYNATELPDYYAYAAHYLLEDQFFVGVLGPSLPNRLYDLGLTGATWTSNEPPTPADVAGPTLPGQLDAAGIRWGYYYAGGPPSYLPPMQVPAISGNPCLTDALRPMGGFGPSIAGPDAPTVAFLDPSGDPVYSEHPPENVTVGESWSAAVIDAILSSPIGPSSVIFLTFDEGGGYWDPEVPPTVSGVGDGFRVPLLVISDWARPGAIDHLRIDPSALLRFVDDDLGLPYLTPDVARAPSIAGFFDFSAPPRAPLWLPSDAPLAGSG